MRVLVVSPYGPYARAYGGIPRVLGTQLDELAARGHQVTLLTTDASLRDERRDPLADGTPASVRVVALPNLSNRWAHDLQLFLPGGLGKALDHCLAAGVDVACLHACHNLLTARSARRLKTAGIPWILSPHGTAPRIERRQLAKRLFDAIFDGRSLEQAARIIAVSRAEVRDLEGMGCPSDRIRVLPNPIVPPPEEIFDADTPRRTFGVENGTPLLLSLAKLTPRKRLDDLLRAWARCESPGVLVLAGNDMGSGPMLRRLAQDLGLAERVHFAGLLDTVSKWNALAAADLVLHPATSEVFGLSVAEALSVGTPVFVADDSGSAELVQDLGGGRILPVGEVETWAGAISEFLDAPEALRGEARRQASETRSMLSASTHGERLDTLLREVVSPETPASSP